MKKPFKHVGYLGLLVIAMSVLLVIIFPSKVEKMPEGFYTPIVAFEFVQNKAEVMQMFGQSDSPARRKLIAAMDLGNGLDYIYMVLYSVFLLLFCLQCKIITGKKFYLIGVVVSLIVLFGDAFENVQLLAITSKIDADNIVFNFTLDPGKHFLYKIA